MGLQQSAKWLIPYQGQRVRSGKYHRFFISRKDKNKSAQRHNPEPGHHSPLKSDTLQQIGRWHSHNKIRDVECKSYEVGSKITQLKRNPEIRNQDGIEPGNKSDNKKKHSDNEYGNRTVPPG
jgi:hypothetical protein